MTIKVVQGGIESDWFHLTKKRHRELLKNPPEGAILRIEDLYPGSPDTGKLLKLPFDLFTLLVRDFVLAELAQEKQIERHHDKRPIDRIDPNREASLAYSTETDFFLSERSARMRKVSLRLSKTQRRRLQLRFVDGLSLREIARIEGVHHTAVDESINRALEKCKILLGGTPTKYDFLSD